MHIERYNEPEQTMALGRGAFRRRGPSEEAWGRDKTSALSDFGSGLCQQFSLRSDELISYLIKSNQVFSRHQLSSCPKPLISENVSYPKSAKFLLSQLQSFLNFLMFLCPEEPCTPQLHSLNVSNGCLFGFSHC